MRQATRFKMVSFLLVFLLVFSTSATALLAETPTFSIRTNAIERASLFNKSAGGIQASDYFGSYEEVEPNDTLDTANHVNAGQTGDQIYEILAAINDDTADVDCFKFTLDEPKTLDLMGAWISEAVTEKGLEESLRIRLFDESKAMIAEGELEQLGETATEVVQALSKDLGPGTYFVETALGQAGTPAQFVNESYGMLIQIAPTMYFVEFESNGGTEVEPVIAEPGSTIESPTAPTRTGYTFAGWFKDEALTMPWNFATDTVTEDMTLYAKWTINQYTVIFKGWDGTTLKTETVNHGGSATAPTPPARAGYTFLGWDKSFANVTENLTVTAQYKSDALPTEGVEGFIVRFYQLCLGRDPDQGGLDYFVGQLKSGAKTGASVAIDFVTSPEFKAMNKTNSEYVAIMYRVFFDREADQGGLDYWLGQMDKGMSRFWVLAGFVNSQEFTDVCQSFNIQRGSITLTDPADCYPKLTAFVTRFYKLTLERMPDEGGLNYWVKDLADGKRTGAMLADNFIFSQEFQNRDVTNVKFMEIMYAAFFDRSPDAGGMNYWLGRLALGYTRHYVLVGYVNSQEFAGICTSYGIQRGSIAQWTEDRSISSPLYIAHRNINNTIVLDWFALNTSGKQITSIDLYYTAYNFQNVRISDLSGRTGPFKLRLTGLAEVDEIVGIENAPVFNNPSAYRLHFDKMDLGFADGTKASYAISWDSLPEDN